MTAFEKRIDGHRQCSSVKALFDGISEGLQGAFTTPWGNMARRAAQCWNAGFLHLSAAEKLCQCEMAAIIVPLDNLRTFPWIKSRIDSGKRKLHGWYFDSMSGAMLNYNEDTLAYKALA